MLLGSILTNSANGSYEFIGGGNNNTASGSNAVIVGGSYNVADGTYSAIPGGYYATTRATYGRFVYASGQFAAVGDAQMSMLVLRALTTDDAPTALTSDGNGAGATNQMILPNKCSAVVTGEVVGHSSDGAHIAGFTFSALVDKWGGVVELPSAVTPVVVATKGYGAYWSITVQADSAMNRGLMVVATGSVGVSVRWVARLKSVEVTY